MTIDQLRQLVLALFGREEVGCASGSGKGTVDDKVGESMREMLGRAHLSLGGDLDRIKVTGRMKTVSKGTGREVLRRKGR